jgi:predicted esterase
VLRIARFARSCLALALPVAALACRTPSPPDDLIRESVARLPAPEAQTTAPTTRAPGPSRPASAPLPASLPDVPTDWCGDGLSGLDEATCYFLPRLEEGAPRRLLVYLHGIVPPSAESKPKSNMRRVIARASARAGAAALVPRGVKGIGPGNARTWWAWPTTRASHDELTPRFVRQWEEARAKLEALAGAPFETIYLAGSSNGAYYLTALAIRGDLDALGFAVHGFAAISGGSGGGYGGQMAPENPRPFYVGYGSQDRSSQRNARSLIAQLKRADWPHAVEEHPFGHGTREVYLDEAFAFWDKAQERLHPGADPR